jgi:hypothetical protein
MARFELRRQTAGFVNAQSVRRGVGDGEGKRDDNGDDAVDLSVDLFLIGTMSLWLPIETATLLAIHFKTG